jgi:hypothetical protein
VCADAERSIEVGTLACISMVCVALSSLLVESASVSCGGGGDGGDGGGGGGGGKRAGMGPQSLQSVP